MEVASTSWALLARSVSVCSAFRVGGIFSTSRSAAHAGTWKAMASNVSKDDVNERRSMSGRTDNEWQLQVCIDGVLENEQSVFNTTTWRTLVKPTRRGDKQKPQLAKVGRCLAEAGRSRPKFDQMSANFRPNLVNAAGRNQQTIGQCGLILTKFGRQLAEIWPNVRRILAEM